MITEERISTFIQSFDTGNTPFLNELEEYAIKTNVPIIRPQMQSFLKLLLAIKKPKQILEVGTAIGFSALLMSEYGPEDCKITTIEKYEKRILRKPERKSRLRSLRGMQRFCLESLKVLMILFLWMRQRDSISISCRIF